MDSLIKLFFSISLLLSTSLLFGEIGGVEGSSQNHHLYGFRPTKLFVFGDSYADTGNIKKSLSYTWKFPYGITFPGKPAGRFSDGRVATDFLGEINGVETSNQHQKLNSFRPKKLFVFGDSYVDTGNIRKPNVVSRKFPYGFTFPGKPSGRFSDGLVATDFLAQLIGIKSPIPYEWIEVPRKEPLKYGINFAYGGTGVFNTLVSLPNMTTQIDFFQKLLTAGNIYSSSDLISSVAFVSVAGNDYSYYLKRNGSVVGFPTFIKQVVDQTEVNLRRIHSLGVKKIAVASLQPLGCLPSVTIVSSFQRCNESDNVLVNLHNNLLQQVVAKLNNETKQSTFVILDYLNAFFTIFKNKRANLGSTRFKTPLKPCCEGNCAIVDEKGAKKYTLCEDPKSAFFWDDLHPSQEGWRSVYLVLGKPLTEFLKKV